MSETGFTRDIHREETRAGNQERGRRREGCQGSEERAGQRTREDAGAANLPSLPGCGEVTQLPRPPPRRPCTGQRGLARDETAPLHRPTRRGKTGLSLSAAWVRFAISGGRRGGDATSLAWLGSAGGGSPGSLWVRIVFAAAGDTARVSSPGE